MTPTLPSADDEDRSENDAAHDGPALVNASFAGTGVLVVAAGVGVISPDRWSGLTAVASGVLFAVGVVAFLYGYAVGVVRSADEQVGLAGLFFLSGTAPRVIRFRMRIAFVAQIVIATAAASIRPYTAVAFAVLAPMLGLGLMSAWGARHGVFFAKDSSGSRE